MQSRFVKEILSPDSLLKAVIRERTGAVIEVIVLKSNSGKVPGFGQVVDPFWEQVSGPSLTNTLDRAEEIAAEALHLGH